MLSRKNYKKEIHTDLTTIKNLKGILSQVVDSADNEIPNGVKMACTELAFMLVDVAHSYETG